MSRFIFKSYNFDNNKFEASFNYAFSDGRNFKEVIGFKPGVNYDRELLDRAMFLAFILIGTSYYKAFPAREIELTTPIDGWQADFFNKVYQDGLSQFAYENNLSRVDLAHFIETGEVMKPLDFAGSGILALQSGGKDSLLTATLLKQNDHNFSSFYVSSSDSYPSILDDISSDLVISRRTIDHNNLLAAKKDGAKNGHVPVTYILQSLAVIQAILVGENTILTSIAHEGEEPHAFIGDLAVRHQWSKIYAAELAFSEYVSRYISSDIKIGSPLRQMSELRVAELFIKNCWKDFGQKFSSCNVANYKQGNDNADLKWCGECSKCANSYLLFSPFLSKDELAVIFKGQDLFEKESLVNDFKGLLGIDGVIKPFECVGETDELRLAYHLARKKNEYAKLPFEVPISNYDNLKKYDSQNWARELAGF